MSARAGQLAEGTPAAAGTAKARSGGNVQHISGTFQLLLALYIILTGTFPSIVQALAFGVEGGAGSEFAVAMLTALVRDLLLLAAVVALTNHPLGMLHPLLLAVVLWPLVTEIPDVIQQYANWGGVMAGQAVSVPYFVGLPTQSASTMWTAVAKYNGLEIISLICTYAGFSLYRGGRNLGRIPPPQRSSSAVRTVFIALIAASMTAFLLFVYSRGGFSEHLTSLGRGRFRELSELGAILVITDLGAIAIYLWVAARPGDAKSPLFLACLVLVTAAQFVSNGSRGQSLFVPATTGLIWALRRQKLPWRLGLILVPVMFTSLGLLGAVRSSSWTGSTASETFATTGWSESMALAQEEMSVRRAASANVPIVERGFAVNDGPLLGELYIAAVTASIPRSIWPGKPRGPDSLYVQRFLGESKQGSAVPVNPEAEMYWNFGLPGVILLSIIYGAVLRAVYHVFWRRFPNPFAIVFYALILTRFHVATKGLVVLQQQLVLLLICYLAVTFFIPENRRVPRLAARGPFPLARH